MLDDSTEPIAESLEAALYLLRRPILAAAGSPAVREALTRAPVTRDVVDRFIAGTSVADAVAAVAALSGSGLLTSLDHLGEGVTDVAGADAATADYLDVLRALDAEGLAAGVEVSIKLSALGSALPDGETLAVANARTIVRAAYAVGGRVTVDMEEHGTVDFTLRAAAELRTDQPDVGVVLQAMLHRTSGDLAQLVGAGTRVRLVKGAYSAPPQVAFQDPADVDLAYVRALKQLMAGDGYPMVGTHDPRLIEIAGRLADENRRGPADFEYQMLFGIRPDEQRRLADTGASVRVYVPYGVDWYAYFSRRLAERPANLLFFLRSLVSRD